MRQANLSADSLILGKCCYRLTVRGRAWVDLTETEACTVGALSRYLHDILMMCGSGIWFEQLKQFMPPRPLEDALQALLALDLIEKLDAQHAPAYMPVPPVKLPARTLFGRAAFG
jgi:hypothetical protein